MEQTFNKTTKSDTQTVSASLGEKTIQNKAKALQDNRPASILQRKANNTGLPDQLKSGIENLSGHSMDDVKVHYNSDKPAQLQAHAYAQGTDIHIASGQEKYLPHEAWHVVQQKQGRVKPTLQMKGKVNVNDDKGLEKEADVMGAKAITLADPAAGQSVQAMLVNSPNDKGIAQLQFQSASTIVFKPLNRPASLPVQLMSNRNNVIQFELKDTLKLIGSYLGIKPNKKSIAAYFGITVAMLTTYITPLVGLSAIVAVTMLRSYGRYHRKKLYDAAVAKNSSYKKRVLDIAEAAKTQKADLRLKNSAEWLLMPVTPMTILSRTGDSDDRVRAAMKDPNSHQALFGSELKSGAASYDWEDLLDPFDVQIQEKGQLGSQIVGKMTLVMSDTLSDKKIQEIIKHEVQHDADEHKDEKGDDALIGYETEYRAYSYEGGKFDAFSNKKVAQEGYTWTEKQYQIFLHIRKYYSYVKEAWNDPNKSKQNKFRKDVVAYKDPDSKGVNKNNSFRITNFWMLLNSIPTGLKRTGNEDYQKLIKQSFYIQELKLTKADAQYILKNGKKIQDKINELMPANGNAYKKLMEKLRSVK